MCFPIHSNINPKYYQSQKNDVNQLNQRLYVTTINELDVLETSVIIQCNAWMKKDLLLLANKSIKNIPDPYNVKEHYQEKQKVSKTIRNYYLSTKIFLKTKNCWYKIYY